MWLRAKYTEDGTWWYSPGWLFAAGSVGFVLGVIAGLLVSLVVAVVA